MQGFHFQFISLTMFKLMTEIVCCWVGGLHVEHFCKQQASQGLVQSSIAIYSIFQRPYINPVIVGQSTSPFILHPHSTYHQKRKKLYFLYFQVTIVQFRWISYRQNKMIFLELHKTPKLERVSKAARDCREFTHWMDDAWVTFAVWI